MAVTSWNSLTVDQRECWNGKAKEAQDRNPSELTDKERGQKIRKAKKQLISQVQHVQCSPLTATSCQ